MKMVKRETFRARLRVRLVARARARRLVNG